MEAQSHQNQENKSLATANGLEKESGDGLSTAFVEDLRPEATAQRRIQTMIDGSPHTRQLKKFQEVFQNPSKEGTAEVEPESEPAGGEETIQQKIGWQDPATMNKLHPVINTNIESGSYKKQFDKVQKLKRFVRIVEEEGAPPEGKFIEKEEGEVAGIIRIPPLEGEADLKNVKFNSLVSAMGQQLQVVMDEIGPKKADDDADAEESGDDARWQVLRKQWRAWAKQAAINKEHLDSGEKGEVKVSSEQIEMVDCFENPFKKLYPELTFFMRTKACIINEVLQGDELAKTVDDQYVYDFMENNDNGTAWLNESQGVFEGG